MAWTLPPQLHQHRHEAVAVAIAAIGVGMFIGTWIIGPAVTYETVGRAAEQTEPMSFHAMLAQPDPSPFRTPTPAFEVSGVPSYAAAAKEKAQAALGGATSADDGSQQFEQQAPSLPRYHRSYGVFDRHRPL